MKTKLQTYVDAENFMYESFLRAQAYIPKADDSVTRDPKRARWLLDQLGKPDQGIKTVLVAGSKGKGSTSHLISILLRGLGYRVGLFTSPHLIQFTERIQVNGQQISELDFLRLTRKIEPYVNELETKLERVAYQGPIGLALSVAWLYFKEQQIDFAVIEAGRGGRFDEANVVSNQWAALSSLFPEHLDTLGPTIEDIIWHKLGIVKGETTTVIVNHQQHAILETLRSELSHIKDLRVYGEQFQADSIQLDRSGITFQLRTERADYGRLHLPLLGAFQANNAATAVACCESIIGDRFPEQLLRDTLAQARWPGRCELLSQNPTVIADGAINAVSALYIQELVETIGFQKVISIVGVPVDKDYEGVIRVVSGFSEQVIISTPDLSHKSFSAEAFIFAKKMNRSSREITPLDKALEFAKQQPGVDLILIVGTQTFIGNAKRLYR
ncbi:hypothetical protein BEP19_00315 [Ammoniphilus oxalaticus]|uniref:Mur ligase central domain-containing protein n=1 Tax=Ammoniphilus oxalaticus TaxID=66863 RepID=A0A419SRA7_9BACL|nr:Mur ligase family protein [Ammoniphilus oxalaticus]RKD27052.1 hypothetical protein BEP19_00315 [Ammoniphilus oxalaticus]